MSGIDLKTQPSGRYYKSLNIAIYKLNNSTIVETVL
jgi:hypothetical protein